MSDILDRFSNAYCRGHHTEYNIKSILSCITSVPVHLGSDYILSELTALCVNTQYCKLNTAEDEHATEFIGMLRSARSILASNSGKKKLVAVSCGATPSRCGVIDTCGVRCSHPTLAGTGNPSLLRVTMPTDHK